MEVDSAPMPTKKGLEELKRILVKDHASVARYAGELDRQDKLLAAAKDGASAVQGGPGKNEGGKPTYSHLARLRLLVGERAPW